jgi:hypothetical protein
VPWGNKLTLTWGNKLTRDTTAPSLISSAHLENGLLLVMIIEPVS